MGPTLLNTIQYPEEEISKLSSLEELFEKWRGVDSNHLEGFVSDGFYPYYFSQPMRILFIGRESRDIAGYSYIEILLNAYRNNKIDKQHINSSFFHKRLMYISYGLNHDFADWQTIPVASEITQTFGKENGLSFAFMNISKLSNPKVDWKSDWNEIDQSFSSSTLNGTNLIHEEIKILDPHIIISMNLGNKVQAFGELEMLERNEKVNTYSLNLGHKTALVLDTFHFTALGKDNYGDFYNPICNAVRKYLREGGLKSS